MEPQSETSSPISGVGFPTPPQPRETKKVNKLVIVGVILLIVAAVLGFIVYLGSQSSSEIEPDATPVVESTNTEEIETPSPTSTPSSVKKSDVKIEVLNGTGISGEAGFLQEKLKALGYTTVTVGNATTSSATSTTVTYSSKLPSDIKNEITEELEKLYANVDVKSSSSLSGKDVQIITGPRKGTTPRPSPTRTPTTSPSASPSSSPTGL